MSVWLVFGFFLYLCVFSSSNNTYLLFVFIACEANLFSSYKETSTDKFVCFRNLLLFIFIENLYPLLFPFDAGCSMHSWGEAPSCQIFVCCILIFQIVHNKSTRTHSKSGHVSMAPRGCVSVVAKQPYTTKIGALSILGGGGNMFGLFKQKKFNTQDVFVIFLNITRLESAMTVTKSRPFWSCISYHSAAFLFLKPLTLGELILLLLQSGKPSSILYKHLCCRTLRSRPRAVPLAQLPWGCSHSSLQYGGLEEVGVHLNSVGIKPLQWASDHCTQRYWK